MCKKQTVSTDCKTQK